MKGVFWLLVVSVVIASWIPLSHCAKKPVGIARKEDVPYIKCQVCEILAKQLYQQVQSKKAEISPKKISEYQIIEIAENVCNLKKVEADWILRIDIVEKADRLEVLGYSDTDVAEYLYSSKPDIDSLTNYLCKDLSKACNTKPPPVPKDRTPGEPFVAKSSKEAEMEKLLKSMEGMPGAPGMKMYSRDDLMKKNFGAENEDDDEDEDEEEDEADFPSKLGKVLKSKENEKGDWKQKIRKGIVDTGTTLKKHATKVSNHIQRWWKGKKTTSSKKNSKSEL
ncbi:uncharacterized protein [Medicago truncatula]|uniref:DUF3456 domain protein n=1 Tax=Medicago truncatula TaxID=3880 RepID=A0A0C3W0H8_MEDTR|nr:uncharacterized protein LOC11427635 [Medicago truncatula]AES77126.2 hypothetical protein MTR_6g092180 [Medicago truncatula]